MWRNYLWSVFEVSHESLACKHYTDQTNILFARTKLSSKAANLRPFFGGVVLHIPSPKSTIMYHVHLRHCLMSCFAQITTMNYLSIPVHHSNLKLRRATIQRWFLFKGNLFANVSLLASKKISKASINRNAANSQNYSDAYTSHCIAQYFIF